MICKCGHLIKEDHEYEENRMKIGHCYACVETGSGSISCCHVLVIDNLKYLEEKYKESIK